MDLGCSGCDGVALPLVDDFQDSESGDAIERSVLSASLVLYNTM